jgi:hypothetical protein
MKNAGATACNCAVAGALAWPLLVTTTFTVPVALSDGACTLICVGLMYSTKAGLPSMVTLTPSSERAGCCREVGGLPDARIVGQIGALDHHPGAGLDGRLEAGGADHFGDDGRGHRHAQRELRHEAAGRRMDGCVLGDRCPEHTGGRRRSGDDRVALRIDRNGRCLSSIGATQIGGVVDLLAVRAKSP